MFSFCSQGSVLVSVMEIPQDRGLPLDQDPLGHEAPPPWIETLTRTDTRLTTEAGGTHLTGMHTYVQVWSEFPTQTMIKNFSQTNIIKTVRDRSEFSELPTG